MGCAYGCRFCASGLDGWKRNLEPSEIIGQILAVERAVTAAFEGDPSARPERWVNNLVIMGMGEPLANYDNVLRALRIINAPWALGIGARATTLPDSLFSLYGVKIVGDGSNQTKTGAQTVPYLGGSDKGKANFDAAAMKKMVADVKAFSLPVQVHCNGDHTIDLALDADQDGRVSYFDILAVARAVEVVEQEHPDLVGGMGVYGNRGSAPYVRATVLPVPGDYACSTVFLDKSQPNTRSSVIPRSISRSRPAFCNAAYTCPTSAPRAVAISATFSSTSDSDAVRFSFVAIVSI